MSAIKNISLTVDEKAHGYAKIYSSLLKSEYQRKRSYACLVALYAFINSLEKTDNKVQKAMTLFRNPLINEEYEISDVYVNNWHLDVRVITAGDAFLIPKSHFNSNILPDFYVVIKVDNELKSAELVGFLESKKTEMKQDYDNYYYSVPIVNLINYAEFLEKVDKPKVCEFSEKDHEFLHSNYIAFMDGELDSESKDKILQHLFICEDCRREFCCFTGFEMVSCNMERYPNLLEDDTLGIIGAQAADNPIYEGKEEIVYFDNDENKNTELPENTPQQIINDKENAISDEISEIETKATETDNNIENSKDESNEDGDETVSDILDELFSSDDDILTYDSIEDKPVEISPQGSDIHSEIELISDNTEEIEPVENDVQPKTETKDEISEPNEIKEIEEIDNNLSDDSNIEELENDEDISSVPDENLTEDNTESDMLLIEDNQDENLISEVEDLPDLEEETNKDENIEEVISDYNEAGDPVYSYVEKVNENDLETIDTEVESIEEINNNEVDSETDYINDSDTNNDILQEELIEESEDESTGNPSDMTYYEQEQESEEPVYHEEDINLENDDILDTDSLEDEVKPVPQSVLYDNMAKGTADDIVYREEDDEENNSDSSEDSEYDEEEYEDDESSEDEESQDEEEYDDNSEDDGAEYDEEYEYDEEEDDDDDESEKGASKGFMAAVLAALVLIALIGGGAFFFLKNSFSGNASNETSSDNSISLNSDEIPAQESNTESIPSQGSIDVNALTEQDLLKIQPKKNTGDVNKIMADAFSNGAKNVSLRGVNWLCTPELFTDKAFKTYLQNLDNILKLNLKKNILNATDSPINDSVGAKLAVDNNGNLQKIIISDTSGSTQIDDIVLQSIKESFEGEKSPIIASEGLKSDMYYLKVVIKL